MAWWAWQVCRQVCVEREKRDRCGCGEGASPVHDELPPPPLGLCSRQNATQSKSSRTLYFILVFEWVYHEKLSVRSEHLAGIYSEAPLPSPRPLSKVLVKEPRFFYKNVFVLLIDWWVVDIVNKRNYAENPANHPFVNSRGERVRRF